MRYRIVLSLLSLLSLLPGVPAASPPSPQALEAASAYSDRTGGDALLVMDGQRIVFERYARGQGPEVPHILASGSKGFACILAALAVADGRMALDAPVSSHLYEWRDDPRRAGVTVRQLLQLGSGLDGGASPLRGGPRHARATAADAIAAPFTAAPGTRFQYGPNPFLVFAEAVRRATGEDPAALLDARVLSPIGARATWTRTADGLPHLGGGARMTARHWAAFGALVRDGGAWRGRRLLPASGVDACLAVSPVNPAYGMGWWLRSDGAASLDAAARGTGVARDPRPSVPMRAAAGAFDQRLYVLSERGWVVVRFGRPGRRGGERFDDATLLRLLDG